MCLERGGFFLVFFLFFVTFVPAYAFIYVSLSSSIFDRLSS